jgi:hypothetical protein
MGLIALWRPLVRPAVPEREMDAKSAL